MAKRDDFDLDDFSLDDFDDDGLGGFDSPNSPSGKRTPIEVLKGGFVDGVKSSFTDPTNQARMIKKALPKGYIDALDVLDKTAEGARSLYDIGAKEAEPIIKDLRRGAKLVMPAAEKMLPKGIAARFKAWAEKEESGFSGGSFDPEKAEIDSATGAIFAAYQEDQKKRETQDQVRDDIKHAVSTKQGQTQLQALMAISSGINRLVSYQDQVTASVQKKTLELQYKQYFVQRKLLDLTKQSLDLDQASYKSLITNTALPEFVKIRKSEMLSQIMQQNFIGRVADGFSDWSQKIAPRVLKKAGESLRGFASNLGANVNQMVGGAEMAKAMTDGQDLKEMGLEMGGQLAGGEFTQWLAGKLAAPIKKRMETGEMGAHALKTERLVKNLPDLLAAFARGEIGRGDYATQAINKLKGSYRRLRGIEDPGFEEFSSLGYSMDDNLQRGLDWFRDAIGTPEKNTMVRRSAVDEVDGSFFWTRRSDTTLNVIIPGWLSKIHNELYIMRSGDKDAQPLTYSFHSGKYEQVTDQAKRILQEVFDPSAMKYAKERMEGILETIDPEKKLDDRVRKALGTYLLRQANNNGSLNLPILAKGGDNFPQELKDHEDAITKHIRDRLGYDEEGKDRGDIAQQDISGAVEERFRNLRDYQMPNTKQTLLREASQGNIEMLEKLGLVKVDDKGTYHMDLEAIVQAIENGDAHVFTDDMAKKFQAPNSRRIRRRALGGRVRRYAKGSDGPVRGPGGPTDDAIDAQLSNGETVINAKGSKIPGMEAFLRWVNRVGNKMRGDDGMSGPGAGDFDPGEKRRSVEELLQSLLEKAEQRNETLSNMLETLVNIPKVPLQTVTIGSSEDVDGDPVGMTFGEKVANKLFRAGRGSAKAAWKSAKWFGSKIKGFNTGMAKGAWGLGKRALKMGTSALKLGSQFLEDIYVMGYDEPVLTAKDIRSGQFIDKNSKKVIRSVSDITGPVIDMEGNFRITQEDFEKGVYGKRSAKFLKLGGLVIGGLRKVGNFVTRPFTGILKLAKSLGRAALRFGEIPKDIYVSGEETPRMLARVIRAGGYKLQSTGKVINRVGDMVGNIVDESGNVVLSVDDMRKGLVDVHGRPIQGLSGRILSLIKGGFGIVKTGFKMAKKVGTFVGDMFGKGLGAIGGALGTLFGKRGFGALFGSPKPIVSRLDKIYDLLDARLPGKKNTSSSDTDGDGDREGSWQDQLQEREESKKKGMFEKMQGMFSGLMSKLKPGEKKEGGGMFGGLLGMLGKIPSLFMGMGGLITSGLGAIKSLTSLLGDGLLKSAVKLGAKALKAIPGAAGALWKGAKTAGSLLGRGGMGLLKGAGNLIRGAATVASWGMRLVPLLTSSIALPLAAVGALAYGGYKLYKYYTQPNTPLAKFRLAQYGFEADDETRVSKIIELEQLCMSAVKVNGTKGAQLGTGLSVEDAIKIFGIDPADKEKLEKFIAWFTQRFKPVFLANVTVLYGLIGKTDITKVDDLLKSKQKLEYLKRVDFGYDSNSPYVYMMSPFPDDDEVPLDDVDDVKDSFDTAKEWIDDHAEETDAAYNKRNGKVDDKKKEETKGIWDSTKEAVGSAWNKSKAAISGAMTSVAQGAKSIGGKIKEGYQTAVDKTSGAIETVAGAYETSKKTFNSLKGSLKEKFHAVMNAARRAGDPHPEVVAAQWALESGWGKHESGKFNFFGIKAKANEPGTIRRTREVFGGKETYINDKFRDYESLDDGIAGRVSFIAKNKRYTKAGYFNATTPYQAAVTLQKAGYATDPKYAALLAKVMSSAGIDPNAPSGTSLVGSGKGPVTMPTGASAKQTPTAPSTKATPATSAPTSPGAKAPAPAPTPAASATPTPVATTAPSTSTPMDNQVAKAKEAQVAQAKQAEVQRQASASSSADSMNAVADVLNKQYQVSLSMDKTLKNIDSTLTRIEKTGGLASGGGSTTADQALQKQIASSNKRNEDNEYRRPPVSMSR